MHKRLRVRQLRMVFRLTGRVLLQGTQVYRLGCAETANLDAIAQQLDGRPGDATDSTIMGEEFPSQCVVRCGNGAQYIGAQAVRVYEHSWQCRFLSDNSLRHERPEQGADGIYNRQFRIKRQISGFLFGEDETLIHDSVEQIAAITFNTFITPSFGKR